ncbi:MAG: hypothetical protein ACKORK_14395 [Gemmatimonadota bacterium]
MPHAPGFGSYAWIARATTAAGRVQSRRAEVRSIFDAVLVDAPCTGTGTFRRHPDARWRLKPSDLAVMSATQRAILRGAAEAVAQRSATRAPAGIAA